MLCRSNMLLGGKYTTRGLLPKLSLSIRVTNNLQVPQSYLMLFTSPSGPRLDFTKFHAYFRQRYLIPAAFAQSSKLILSQHLSTSCVYASLELQLFYGGVGTRASINNVPRVVKKVANVLQDFEDRKLKKQNYNITLKFGYFLDFQVFKYL